jgi:hypothetical protein
MPAATMAELVRKFPEHQWVSLQVDASEEDTAVIKAAGVECYPGTINDFADTAALMHHLDHPGRVGLDYAGRRFTRTGHGRCLGFQAQR